MRCEKGREDNRRGRSYGKVCTPLFLEVTWMPVGFSPLKLDHVSTENLIQNVRNGERCGTVFNNPGNLGWNFVPF